MSYCGNMSEDDTPVRVLSFIKKDPSITSEEFQRYWREVHAPKSLEYMRKYGVQFYSQVRSQNFHRFSADIPHLLDVHDREREKRSQPCTVRGECENAGVRWDSYRRFQLNGKCAKVLERPRAHQNDAGRRRFPDSRTTNVHLFR